MLKQGSANQGPNLTMACLCMGPGCRMAFTFLRGCKKYKEVSAIEAICGPENPKYLLSALYQKEFADQCSRVKSSSCSNRSYYITQQKLSFFKRISRWGMVWP